MYFQNASYRVYFRSKNLPLLFAGFCLLIFLIVGFIYDNDPTDTDDPPALASPFPAIIYSACTIVILIKLYGISVSLPLINKLSFLNRAPPA